MKVNFIGQGYNLEEDTSIFNVLAQALENKSFSNFKCLVAFASPTGVRALGNILENAKDHITECKIIVGVDQFGTSKEALEELLKLKDDVFIFYTEESIIFHPKIYVFEGDEEVLVISGSNNLTQLGLVQNIEGAISVAYNKNDTPEPAIHTQIDNYFTPLLNGEGDNLHPLSEGLIEELVVAGVVKDEAFRKAQYHKVNIASPEYETVEVQKAKKKISGLFPKFKRQSLPGNFFKTNSVAALHEAKPEYPLVEKADEASSVEHRSWEFKDESAVLIAEIGGGSRWKQVNFPIRIFEDFFGAKKGDNKYHINLRHVASDNKLEEVENRQAVSVKSQNYRFEIGAAKSDYPSGPDRPIGVFIRTGERDFMYHLLMPEESGLAEKMYEESREFLYNKYDGPDRNLKRVETSVEILMKNCPALPFWNN